MEQKVQRMLWHSFFSLPLVLIDMKRQAGNGLSQDADTGVNRRGLHGDELVDILATG